MTRWQERPRGRSCRRQRRLRPAATLDCRQSKELDIPTRHLAAEGNPRKNQHPSHKKKTKTKKNKHNGAIELSGQDGSVGFNSPFSVRAA